jgi:hypothetical protein
LIRCPPFLGHEGHEGLEERSEKGHEGEEAQAHEGKAEGQVNTVITIGGPDDA